ncbi:flavastacin [Deinococcus carri]|uniref:Flavastacin n=1 Tax=Deinococcus carri TaxID=1211323 RepID=A0ABP9WCL0_9DEIO
MNSRLAFGTLGLTLLLAACSNTPGEVPQAGTTPSGPVSATKPETRPATLIMPDGSRQAVTGFVRDGMLLLEDDIILADNVNALKGQGTYVVDTRYRWTNNTIPYTFASNVPQAVRDRVTQAASNIRTTTNVNVTPRSSQANYVQVVYNTGTTCSSSLGMVGGQQTLNLADRCSVGSIMHEFGHAMGLFHEQTRPDRDTYVEIQWQNIPADWQSQYEIRSGSKGYGTYDFDSIMHYPAYFDGKLAIKPLDSSIDINRMGQRNGYSSTDVGNINFMYPATTPTPGTTYTGSASQGASSYQPGTSGFSYAGGTLTGKLSGPSGTDFDLYLQKYNGSAWTDVATSESSTSSESINYTATSGTYRWEVYAYAGSGSYTLVETR